MFSQGDEDHDSEDDNTALSSMEQFREVPEKGAKKKSFGSFKAMGLPEPLLRGIANRGYRQPTPVQRKAIPLMMEGRDVVAMARTGSGKTAAFLIPLFIRLREHRSTPAPRALILSPTRELALQTTKFFTELSRHLNLTTAVLIGGDKMEDQFALLHSNPDVIIATPGRLLHLLEEMGLRLAGIEFVVLDECDRLFEMGFAAQVREILSKVPSNRQTALFSATIPQQLAEFAAAGLHNPVLVKLDAETRLSNQLTLEFVSCHSHDKTAVLFHIIHNLPATTTVMVFAATRYHVDLIHAQLKYAGLNSAYIYSNLDPTARKIQLGMFLTQQVRILVVTDLAARGIDLPTLDVAINYHFPASAKVFVHRVGRVARAGKLGTAYSIICQDELPYVMDFHLHIEREPEHFGCTPQTVVDEFSEMLRHAAAHDQDMIKLLKSADNGFKKYKTTRPSPGQEGARKAKGFSLPNLPTHKIFEDSRSGNVAEKMVAKFKEDLKGFRSKSTIFETGRKAGSTEAAVMAEKRRRHDRAISAKRVDDATEKAPAPAPLKRHLGPVPFAATPRKDTNKQVQDEEFFVSYVPRNHITAGLGGQQRELGIHAIKEHTVDLVDDETEQMMKKQRWDRKKRKFVPNNQTGDAKKLKTKTESGQWIPKSFKKGIYENWKTKNLDAVEADAEQRNKVAARGGLLRAANADFRSKRQPGMQRRGNKFGASNSGGGPSRDAPRQERRAPRDIVRQRADKKQRISRNSGTRSKRGSKGGTRRGK